MFEIENQLQEEKQTALANLAEVESPEALDAWKKT